MLSEESLSNFAKAPYKNNSTIIFLYFKINVNNLVVSVKQIYSQPENPRTKMRGEVIGIISTLQLVLAQIYTK